MHEGGGALATAGLTADDLRTALREDGLLSVLQLLGSTFGDNLDVLSSIVPNIRALTGFLSLTGENGEKVTRIFKDMNDVAGATDDAFSAVADTAEFQLDQALTKIKVSLTEAGAEAAPDLIAAVESLIPLIQDLIPVLSNAGAGFLGFLGSLQPVFVGLSDVALGFENIGAHVTDIFETGLQGSDNTRLLDQLAGLRDAIQSGADPAVELANRLVELGRDGDISAAGLRRLQAEAGLSNDGMLNVARTLFEAVGAGKAVGFTIEELITLFGDLPGAMDLATLAADPATQAFIDINTTGFLGAEGIVAVDDAAAELDTTDAAVEVSALDQAFLDAIESGEGLRETMLGIADPVFAAVDSFSDYQDTLKDVDKDGKRTGAEVLKVAEAALRVGADFQAASLESGAALDIIAAAAGVSSGDVIAALEDIGIQVEGGVITAEIVAGMLAGLDGLGQKFADKANGELNYANDIIQARQLIQSPSKLWADTIGKPIGLGIAAGISDAAGNIDAALQGAVPLPMPPTTGPQVSRTTSVQIINPSTRDLVRDTDRLAGVLATQDLALDLVRV